MSGNNWSLDDIKAQMQRALKHLSSEQAQLIKRGKLGKNLTLDMQRLKKALAVLEERHPQE